MAGHNVSYNLRPNKFVERKLFVDLIGQICTKPKSSYVYISMGGPQLEDHKLFHYQLGLEKLISIESEPLVYDRQRFNARPGCIDIRLQSVSELIADFAAIDEDYPNEDYIIWLDYAAANKRYEQLSEFQSLISTLNNNDFIKITVNANVTSLGERLPNESIDQLKERRLQAVKQQLGEYFDDELFSIEDITKNGFVKIIHRAIEIAAKKGLSDDLNYLELLSFVYQDGPHRMINVGYKLSEKESELQELHESLKEDWIYLPNSSTKIYSISIPNLSVKERLYIDAKIIKEDAINIHKSLPFKFDKDERRSLETLKQYLSHYRRYPNFIDVII
ncbi:MAG: O-methyltransferase [Bacteroidota bacterium]